MSKKSIGDVDIDVILSEEHTYESEVTSHPVEGGTDTADNVVNKQLIINLDCIVTDTPLQTELDTGLPRSERARISLLAIRNNRNPITVMDSQGTFPNMILERVTFGKTIKTGEALSFRATLKEILFVTNERTIVQVTLPRAQSVSKRGAKSSKPPDPPVNKATEDDRDPLRRLLNNFGYTSRTPNTGF